jgi:hypothetical protein
MRLLSLLSPPRAVPHFKEFMETAVKMPNFLVFIGVAQSRIK